MSTVLVISRARAEDILWNGDIIETEITDQDRWATHRRTIFRYDKGVYAMYTQNGSTEMQECDQFYGERLVVCKKCRREFVETWVELDE